MTRRELVLVADDDPHVREMVRFALEKAGFEVTAGDGEEALAHFRERAPDLVVLDILIPELRYYKWELRSWE
jgi:two-component system OmpR family response regulator